MQSSSRPSLITHFESTGLRDSFNHRPELGEPVMIAARIGDENSSMNMNEWIDVSASQLKSAYCKASRSVDCAFGSAICRENSLRC